MVEVELETNESLPQSTKQCVSQCHTFLLNTVTLMLPKLRITSCWGPTIFCRRNQLHVRIWSFKQWVVHGRKSHNLKAHQEALWSLGSVYRSSLVTCWRQSSAYSQILNGQFSNRLFSIIRRYMDDVKFLCLYGFFVYHIFLCYFGSIFIIVCMVLCFVCFRLIL
jgi:hypothetical protein